MNFYFLDFVLRTPWALRPEVMSAYGAILMSRYARKAGVPAAHGALEVSVVARGGGEDGPEDEVGHGTRIEARSGAGTGRAGSIAVIPVRGTIVQRADMLDLCEGGTSTEDIAAALHMAVADETIASVLLHIHSPGGSVYGVQELGDQIREANKSKPVVAIADSLAASAAYWIGCCAGEFYCTPGGEVGSIGVWSAHQDISKALAEMGVDIKLISAGKFKVEGNPYEPLGEEARGFMQKRIDEYYDAFTKAVAKGRKCGINQVREHMGQGRVLGAAEALSENMIDGVMTMQDVVKKMQRDARAAASNSSGRANRAEDLAATTVLADAADTDAGDLPQPPQADAGAPPAVAEAPQGEAIADAPAEPMTAEAPAEEAAPSRSAAQRNRNVLLLAELS